MKALVIVDMQPAYFKDKRLQTQRDALIAAIQNQIGIFTTNHELILNIVTVHSYDRTTWTLNMKEDDKGFLLDGSDET